MSHLIIIYTLLDIMTPKHFKNIGYQNVIYEYDQEIPHSHTFRPPTHGTMRKSHRTVTDTIHQEDN